MILEICTLVSMLPLGYYKSTFCDKALAHILHTFNIGSNEAIRIQSLDSGQTRSRFLHHFFTFSAPCKIPQ